MGERILHIAEIRVEKSKIEFGKGLSLPITRLLPQREGGIEFLESLTRVAQRVVDLSNIVQGLRGKALSFDWQGLLVLCRQLQRSLEIRQRLSKIGRASCRERV